MATHTLIRALRANKPAFGAWLSTPGFLHARIVAQASPHMSWIAVDCEHGLISLNPGASESIAAIHGLPKIKYALDAGARGVIVPMISTADKAREVVADSRFPPIGRRGFGSPFTHDNWGITASEYLETANENILVMVQIETKEGVNNVKEIAAVDGVDVLFIGPYDLSISLGFPPPSPDPHPDVERVIQDILKVAHSADKKCAIYCTSGHQAANRAAEGFDMINVINDVGALSGSLAEHLAIASGVQ